MRFTSLTKPTLGLLAGLALTSLASAQCPAADALEPNDDCASAIAVLEGNTPGLTRTGPASPLGDNPDFFSFTVAGKSSIQVDLTFANSGGDIDLYLYDVAGAGCSLPMTGSTYLVRGFTGSDNESVTWANDSCDSVDLLIGVDRFGSSFDCNDYSMDITVTALVATCPGADALEPNDTCLTAVPLALGATTDLTMFGAGNGAGVNLDFYSFTLLDGDIATIDALFCNSGGDTDIFLYDDAGTCSNEVAQGFSGTDDEQIIYSNTTGGPVTYVLEVSPFGSSYDCNDYSLNLAVVAGTIVCPAADAFEPNDDCTNPAALPLGLTQSLSIWGPGHATQSEDSWTYTAVNNEMVTIDVLFLHSGGDIDVTLWDDALCSSSVDSSGSSSDNEQVSYLNTTGGPVTLTMTTRSWGSFVCNDYELDVTSVIDPCFSVSEDAFSPNHDCASAVSVGAGSYPGLATFKVVAEDFFSIDVPTHGTLIVDCLFTAADGDIDIYLYDPSTLGTTCGDKSSDLVNGFSSSDNEHIEWTNTSGATVSYILQVNIWDNSGQAECNVYDLVVDVQEKSHIGVPFCFGDGTSGPCPCVNDSGAGDGEGCLNQNGHGAKIAMTGSTSVSADDAVFHLTQGNPSETGMLVQGLAPISVPFKDGILCMGGFTRRVEAVNVDADGHAETVTSMATSANLFPGQSRHYQYWYRDSGGTCGTGSNFSNGLTILWTM